MLGLKGGEWVRSWVGGRIGMIFFKRMALREMEVMLVRRGLWEIVLCKGEETALLALIRLLGYMGLGACIV
jgi:hypothetical protein